MKVKPSQKTILIVALLAIFALACSLSGARTPTQTASTPDALGTVLADVANATEKADETQAAMPEASATQETSQDETGEPAATEDVITTPLAINTATPTLEITNTPNGYPTAIPLPNPQASNFYTCLTNCAGDGSNHQTSFPQKIEIIYFRFDFTEFPIGAPYSRAWYKDGVEWVRYDCYWPGPEAGVEQITLTDPLGLPSGTWNLVITINGVQVLNESLTIQGSWNQWSPPGHFNTCYGKR